MCPRHALANVIRNASDKFDISFLLGFEVEFGIMQRSADGKLVPLSTGYGRCAASGLRDPGFKMVEEAVQILLEAGVSMEGF